jgi:hypothetical protein
MTAPKLQMKSSVALEFPQRALVEGELGNWNGFRDTYWLEAPHATASGPSTPFRPLGRRDASQLTRPFRDTSD